MSTQKDGGPAFPYSIHEDMNLSEVCRGITKRDWFAGQALQGLMSNYELLKMLDEQSPKLPTRHVAAQHAYGFADAMLKERDRVVDKEEKP